jgi:hypothetical protein
VRTGEDARQAAPWRRAKRHKSSRMRPAPCRARLTARHVPGEQRVPGRSPGLCASQRPLQRRHRRPQQPALSPLARCLAAPCCAALRSAPLQAGPGHIVAGRARVGRQLARQRQRRHSGSRGAADAAHSSHCRSPESAQRRRCCPPPRVRSACCEAQATEAGCLRRSDLEEGVLVWSVARPRARSSAGPRHSAACAACASS